MLVLDKIAPSAKGRSLEKLDLHLEGPNIFAFGSVQAAVCLGLDGETTRRGSLAAGTGGRGMSACGHGYGIDLA